MLKTYLYVPEELDEKIVLTARIQNKSKAEIIRQAIQEGLRAMDKSRNGGAETLLKLAEIGRKAHLKGPKNSSQRIDELLWGRDWSKNE